MATRRSYAYQIKGNKISLLQNQFGYGSGQGYVHTAESDINEIGPTGKPSWVSPTINVTGGIEIEYAYSPTYTLSNNTGVLSIFGWGFGYNGKLGIFDVDTLDNVAIVGNKNYFKGTRWAGIHTGLVEGAATTGAYYTEEAHISEQSPNKATQLIGTTTDMVALSGSTYAYIIGDNTSYKDDIEEFKDMISETEYYIHISGMATAGNNGIFKVQSSSTHGQIDIISKASKAENEYTFAAFTGTAVDGDMNTTITYIHYSPGFQINLSVDTLDDESDTIDLPPYLSKALVYYIRAKVAEDQMDMERKEYFMREFKRMVEKHQNSQISGPRRVMGFGMTR